MGVAELVVEQQSITENGYIFATRGFFVVVSSYYGVSGDCLGSICRLEPTPGLSDSTSEQGQI